MQFLFSLSLPRDSASVPVVRGLVRVSLNGLGVTDACVGDIEVALTEACTNVLRHADGQDEYQVAVEVNEVSATLRVMDTGRGFDHRTLLAQAGRPSEGGRGILLMRALVDNVSFNSQPEAGTVVNLVKKLSFAPGSLMAELDGSGDGAAEMPEA